jgi:predicted transcriptional regulator
MRMRKSLSGLELELLRHLSSEGPKSVREVADGFGAQQGYARTTIQTVMERLRSKGYASRRRVGGVFQYSSALSQSELLRGVVGRFVDRALGGSVAPLVAYLSENPDLSDEEIASLRRMIDSLERGSQ